MGPEVCLGQPRNCRLVPRTHRSKTLVLAVAVLMLLSRAHVLFREEVILMQKDDHLVIVEPRKNVPAQHLLVEQTGVVHQFPK